jgi:hypothetical protein
MNAAPTFGEESVSRPTPMETLSVKAPNPVAYLHSVAFRNTLDFGAPNGSAYFLNNVKRPAGAPEWSMNFLVRFFFPR